MKWKRKQVMVAMRTQLENRYSNCLCRYRTFFVLGLVFFCVQIYLACTYFPHASSKKHHHSGRAFPDEDALTRDEEEEGLLEGTRQLKLPPDKRGNSNSALNHNRSSRVKLDSKTLNFTPMCEVTGREAVSAISRAHSQMCKERIVNVTCLSQQNLLYPTKLQSSCPHSLGFTGAPRSLGCFRDDKLSRLLPHYYTVFKTNNSPEHCAHMCLQSGYSYAGVEYSMECFCGKEKPSKINLLSDSSCNMKCPGDPKQRCGGYLTINVFSTGIKRFKSHEAKNSSSKNTLDESIRIAYLLTVNGRASRQVKRLISILYDPLHLFYIHVDARQDYMYREMLEVEKKCKLSNIIVAKGPDLRHASIWGGASLLTTFLTSAHQMLLRSKNWDFLVNLSESDYPIKTNARLIEFLGWNRGMNFVKSHGREVQRFLTKQGLDKTFVECEARMWRVGDRKLPHGIQIDGGSDWVALSRDFVEYIAQPHPDELISGLLSIFKYTLLPAESFFHTALRNSRFCDTYVDNNLHVTNWKRKLGCKCQYKAIVDWCGCSPNDFKVEDFGRIKNTVNKSLFFARKFEPVIDQRIIDRVDQWLYPERANASGSMFIKGSNAYWQSLYHHEDVSPLVDDALLTVSSSLARLVYRRIGEPFRSDVAGGVHLLESTAYFRENRFVGVLQNDFPEQLEALVQPRRNLSTSKLWLNKILLLTVNTEYDQKEQIFRNFLTAMGPLSEPVLAYEFDADLPKSLPLNITVAWIDPLDRLAEINYLLVDEVSLSGHLKPQLIEPLSVGFWHIFLVLESKVVASLSFLVAPLSHWRNRPIGYEKSRELNYGPTSPFRVSRKAAERWLEFLRPHIINTKRATTRHPTEVLIGWHLERWVDRLIAEHYEITKVCDASEDRRSTLRKLRKSPSRPMSRCISTDWSSLAPDLKSDVRNLCPS
ncbi:xylosyltransferase oxt [Copidosoma floridanum]|uniref:xylosyltransferase oxt n=1 Tax=Copidosoma floridanum TaxID=29053 RepID=UPI0006C9A3AB|nr:xylosyltransferase oxt [Copidosoma floridanum]